MITKPHNYCITLTETIIKFYHNVEANRGNHTFSTCAFIVTHVHWTRLTTPDSFFSQLAKYTVAG